MIRVRDGLSRSHRYSAFGRISAKHVDFLVCHRGTFRIAGVIELDDSSHLRAVSFLMSVMGGSSFDCPTRHRRTRPLFHFLPQSLNNCPGN